MSTKAIITHNYLFRIKMIKKSRKSHNFFKCTYITSGGGKMTTHGIDVSQYQGLIDWEVVKDRIDFAIIRCGFGQDRPNQDDKLFKEFPIIGKMIKEDGNQILFHRLNVISQIDAVTVINKKQIAHMSDTAVDLPYYNFLLNNNKTKGTFDPHHLLDKSYDMTYELKENDMVTLDDVIYGRVTGIIKKKKNDSFVLKEIRDYAYKEELELKYSDIISVDLNSNDLFNLKSYRNFL